MKTLSRLLVVAALATAPAYAEDAPKQEPKKCDDPVPKECPKIKFLGEDKDCACFVCSPGTKQRKVICTKDDEAKKALYKMRDESEEKGEKSDKPEKSDKSEKAPATRAPR